MADPRRTPPATGSAPGRPSLARAALVVALGLALAAPAAARAADEVLAPDHVVEADSLSAARGVQVWLRWDGSRYRLVERVGGQLRDAPVPPFAPQRDQGTDDRGLPGADGVPNLGSDRRGRLVAVYPRCGSRRGGPRDCDVYAYAPGSGERERRVAHASSRACRERTPSMWRGVVVLTRGRRTRACRPGLYVVRPDGSERRLRPPAPGLGPDFTFVTATDVRGSRVLVAVTGITAEAEATGIDTDIALFRTSGGRARVIARGSYVDEAEPGEQAGSDVGAPQLDGRHALWTRSCYRATDDGLDATTDLVRLDLRARDARPVALAPRAEADVAAFAVDGRSVLYALGGSETGVRRASDPPRAFDGRPCDGGR